MTYEYECPNCNVTYRGEGTLIHTDDENVAKNKERETYNKECVQKNIEHSKLFEEEMKKVKGSLPLKKQVEEKFKEIRIFSGDKTGYEILKAKIVFSVEESFYPKHIEQVSYLPVRYVECPHCKHKEYIR